MAIMRQYTKPSKKLVTDDSSEDTLKLIDPPGVVAADAREPTDYGRSLGMAWYALEGFGIIYQSGNDPSATNSRILKWDSAS